MKRSLKLMLIASVASSSLIAPLMASNTTYSYDELGRLIKTEYTGPGSEIDYAYDELGNRTSVTISGTAINAANDAPTVDYTVMSVISPLDNDGGGTAPISVTGVSTPTNGTAVIASNGVDIEYTPNSSFQGSDSFTYTITDAASATSQGTVSVTVSPPVEFSIDADESVTEGGSVTFTVNKTGSTTSTQTVDIATMIGTATAADFTANSQSLSFLASETSKTFTVVTTADTMYEGDEDFTVQLSNPSSGAALGTATKTGTINDDDGINFSISDASITEGGNLSFDVTKSGTTAMAHSLTFSTSNGTAGASDYTTDSGTISFAAAETTKTITIATTQDATYEADETISVDLSAPTAGATIIDGNATGTITNDDTAPAFSVNNVSASEGNTLSFTVTMSPASSLAHNVNYASANHTAISSDYTAVSGGLVFSPGQTSKTVNVATTENGSYENNEIMRLNLSSATNGATIGDAQGDGTINNDDAAPHFKINDVTKVEGQNLTFTITKTGATLLTHNINYATSNNTAKSGSDYYAKSGTLSFAWNQTSKTVTISGKQDTIVEPTERFRVNLTTATNGATISDSLGWGYITNDDVANAAPNAVNDTYNNVNKSVWTTLNVRGNDSDPDSDPFTITSTSGGNGTVQIINSSTQLRYRCLSGCGSDDLFTYTISDGSLTDTATVIMNFSGGLPLF